ncbi:MAG: hypothetical protein KBS96_01180 [Lachnospiraceae bacterium]|nr:hypothetical protein [Candidatus Colinaster scatohippi]
MKKRAIAVLLMATTAMYLTACWSEKAVEVDDNGIFEFAAAAETATEDSTGAETEEEVAGDATYVKPIAFVYDLANPTDGELYASFNISDLNTETGELTFKAYSLDLYDAQQISMLQQGDILIYENREIIVDNIEVKDGELYVNGGIEDGGCILVGYEGGTYISRGVDDIATYSEIGTLTLTVSESTHISDSYRNPNAPVEVGYDEIQNYIKSLDGSEAVFSYYCTTVQVSGGKIVNITRHWMP